MRTRVPPPVATRLSMARSWPLALALISACAVEQPPEMTSCMTRSDCASNEVCELGFCTPQSSSPARRQDAGPHYPRPDAGVDSGLAVPPDSGQADSGETAADATSS